MPSFLRPISRGHQPKTKKTDSKTTMDSNLVGDAWISPFEDVVEVGRLYYHTGFVAAIVAGQSTSRY